MTKNTRIFLAFTALIILFGTWNMIDAHERAHAAVCRYLDGNASISQWADFNGIHGRTYCTNIPDDRRDQYEALNALVETAGYQEQALWLNFVLMQLGLLAYLAAQRRGKE